MYHCQSDKKICGDSPSPYGGGLFSVQTRAEEICRLGGARAARWVGVNGSSYSIKMIDRISPFMLF